jgi:hypothetical protein
VSIPQRADGQTPKPNVVILDSSVLLQIIATGHFGILRSLRSEFGVQSVIVPAVESEVLAITENVAKFRGRREQFKKALRNKTVAIVDRDFLAPFLLNATESWIRQIDSEGTRLYEVVDRGEAFTHAASMILNVPVATNDTTAVSKLVRQREPIPRPVLRFWDLIVFSHQAGWLTANDCDAIRQLLDRIGERNPACFTKHSFEDGLPHFYARLTCADLQVLGANQPQEKFDERMILARTSPPLSESRDG